MNANVVAKNVIEGQDCERIWEKADRLRSRLTVYAFGIFRDWSSAQDAVQDAYVTFYREMHRYDRTRELFPWIKSIVRNQSIPKVVKRNREISIETLDMQTVYDKSLEDLLEDNSMDQLEDYISVLRSCVSELPKRSQEYLRLLYDSKRTSRSVAENERRSAPGFRVTMCRVRKRLRTCMQKKIKVREVGGRENLKFTLDRYFDNVANYNEVRNLCQDLDADSMAKEIFREYLLFEIAMYEVIALEGLFAEWKVAC